MDAYTVLAQYYDALMAHVDYEGFAKKIFHLIGPGGIVLDLGCGTGLLSSALYNQGYDVIGVDTSVDMLDMARRKTSRCLFLNQSMDNLDLYGTVKAVISTLDSLNYITEENELKEVFKRVHLFLDPEGFFVFDIHSPGVLASRSGMARTAEAKGIFCVWEYEWEAPICNINVNIFQQKDKINWLRFRETHIQREYKPDYIEELLHSAGFTGIEKNVSDLNCFDTKKSDRTFFICRK